MQAFRNLFSPTATRLLMGLLFLAVMVAHGPGGALQQVLGSMHRHDGQTPVVGVTAITEVPAGLVALAATLITHWQFDDGLVAGRAWRQNHHARGHVALAAGALPNLAERPGAAAGTPAPGLTARGGRRRWADPPPRPPPRPPQLSLRLLPRLSRRFLRRFLPRLSPQIRPPSPPAKACSFAVVGSGPPRGRSLAVALPGRRPA